uniref:Uncharacterized protein n=1 Tax=Arundo donax TaxID=35708 RepID=A0A0A9A4N7_ARUDO
MTHMYKKLLFSQYKAEKQDPLQSSCN